MNVLIADDDADLRELVTIAVEKAGGAVVAAVGTGTDAWAALQSTDIDLAVLDISMPGMTGLEVTRLAREHPALRDLTILIITADGSVTIGEEATAAGADALIRKPFQVRELVRSLRDLGTASGR
ncbi:response regulator [Herbiconiux sp. P15]|uniref:response regulator n=1 Tax=Herbiconiux liukaitaii TaxID=3342799 RepID=UPI0035B813B1